MPLSLTDAFGRLGHDGSVALDAATLSVATQGAPRGHGRPASPDTKAASMGGFIRLGGSSAVPMLPDVLLQGLVDAVLPAFAIFLEVLDDLLRETKRGLHFRWRM